MFSPLLYLVLCFPWYGVMPPKPCLHLHLSTSWIYPTEQGPAITLLNTKPIFLFLFSQSTEPKLTHIPMPITLFFDNQFPSKANMNQSLLNLTHIASNHWTYPTEFIVFFPSLILPWHGLSFVILLFYFSHCILYPHFVLLIYNIISTKISPPRPSNPYKL